MGDFIDPADLEPFEPDIPADKADAMIADTEAQAKLLAPCITDDTFEHGDALKAVLRAAILRWNDAGSGAAQQQTAGPFSIGLDTRQIRKGIFWPSEIEQLQSLCSSGATDGAYAIDTVPTVGNAGHADICSLNFGAAYCSCGAVLTNALYPLYEV